MDVAIPDNYISFESFTNWLRKNIPHERHRLDRWQLVARKDAYYLWFRDPADATLFSLMWK